MMALFKIEMCCNGYKFRLKTLKITKETNKRWKSEDHNYSGFSITQISYGILHRSSFQQALSKSLKIWILRIPKFPKFLLLRTIKIV